MKALYQLSKKIAGFDFFPWLVMQAQAGATEIVFDTNNPKVDKWPMATVMRRFESILLPGPALLGLPCSLGTEGRTDLAPYHQRDLVRLSYSGIQFPRLKTVWPAQRTRYTVTLRKTERSPSRNSDEQAWRAFAQEIGALVIPDYDDEPIHLHERMAYYAGADMNFFVTNGPLILCALSEYPAMIFDNNISTMVKLGVPYGDKYPFCLPQHHQIYESATPETIRHHFNKWKATQ